MPANFIKFPAQALCGALILATMYDCPPAPPPVSTLTTDVAVSVEGHDDDETTAAVIPPGWNKLCPNGRVIISSGPRLKNDPAAPPFPLPGRNTLNFPAVLVRNLDGQGDSKEVPLPAPTPLGDYNMVTADSQLVRLDNDNVVLIFGVALKTVPTDGEQLKVFNQWKDFNGGWRGAFLIWRTADCGETWSQPSVVLDSAKVTVSRSTPSGALEDVVGFGSAQGTPDKPWIGGYDMQWAYTDPWRPNSLYIATLAVGGTATDAAGNLAFPNLYFNKIIVLASNDGGVTWNKPTVLLSNDGADYPVAMTSLPPNKRHPGGRLFAFRCLYGTGEPRLYWSDDQWKTLAGQSSVYYNGSSSDPEVKCMEGLPQATLPGGGMRYSGGISISRVKSDKTRDWVRVTYASVTASGRQVQRVVLVEIERKSGSSQENVKTTPARTFEAEGKGPGGHVLYATFIETDRVELKDDDVNAAVLYWAETTPLDTVIMRYAVVKGGGADSVGEWNGPHYLSVRKGARRQLLMIKGDWFGDYFKGAFFLDGFQLKYLAQWAERRLGAHRSVSYNVVTVQP
jgi:hypothetical protein